MAAHLGFSEVVPYAVSKAAVCGMTRGLAVEWASDNLCVNSIAPGWFPSEMSTQAVSYTHLDVYKRQKEQYPGFLTVGTTSHKQRTIYEMDLTVPLLFMIGNETDGLSHGLKDICDVLATIPMNERACASSFNVGCAATVLFYEAVRQRRIGAIR